MIKTSKVLRAGPRKTGAKSGSGSDGVSGEKVRFEPELDHQVGTEGPSSLHRFFPNLVRTQTHLRRDDAKNADLLLF